MQEVNEHVAFGCHDILVSSLGILNSEVYATRVCSLSLPLSDIFITNHMRFLFGMEASMVTVSSGSFLVALVIFMYR